MRSSCGEEGFVSISDDTRLAYFALAPWNGEIQLAPAAEEGNQRAKP